MKRCFHRFHLLPLPLLLFFPLLWLGTNGNLGQKCQRNLCGKKVKTYRSRVNNVHSLTSLAPPWTCFPSLHSRLPRLHYYPPSRRFCQTLGVVRYEAVEHGTSTAGLPSNVVTISFDGRARFPTISGSRVIKSGRIYVFPSVKSRKYDQGSSCLVSSDFLEGIGFSAIEVGLAATGHERT